MGDVARFRVFADLIAERWPDRSLRIADVAGGKGYLNAELYRRGYRNVVTYDRRKDRWTARAHYRYDFFTADADRGFDLVVGMHPDGGTDQAIAYCERRRKPFAVVPCCIVPSAYPYEGPRNRESWVEHLCALAERAGFAVERTMLSINGANDLLVGIPCRNG